MLLGGGELTSEGHNNEPTVGIRDGGQRVADSGQGIGDGDAAEEEDSHSSSWAFVRRDNVLGRGGNGVVYEGIHKGTGQLVALKEIMVFDVVGCC